MCAWLPNILPVFAPLISSVKIQVHKKAENSAFFLSRKVAIAPLLLQGALSKTSWCIATSSPCRLPWLLRTFNIDFRGSRPQEGIPGVMTSCWDGWLWQLLNKFHAKAALWLLNQPPKGAPHRDTTLREEKGLAGVFTGASPAAAAWKHLALCRWSQRGREGSAAIDESIGTSAHVEAKQRSGNAAETGSSGAACGCRGRGQEEGAGTSSPTVVLRLHPREPFFLYRGAEPSHNSLGMGSRLAGNSEYSEE